MLKTLRIRNLAIIEDLIVEFGPGLNLLTGETGAGKSILVDAMGLAVGERADSTLVRSGAERAIVEAVFDVPAGSEVATRLAEAGIDLQDGELAVRREVAAAGSGRVYIGGSPSTVSLLREVGRAWVELHGQHEHQSLLSGETHLRLLDEFAGHPRLLAEVERAHDSLAAAREQVERLEASERTRRERIDQLREQVREIDTVAPQPDELAEVDRERRLLQNAGTVADNLDQALALLYEGDATAGAQAAAAAARLGKLEGLDPELDEIGRRIESARVELDDLGASLRDYRARTDFDPRRLEDLETRKTLLERLLLRFGPDETAALEQRESAARELKTLEQLDAQRDQAAAELQAARSTFVAAAARLTRSRKQAAGAMSAAAESQFSALALEQASLGIVLEPARGEAGPRGAERAEFHFAANPGEDPRPLTRVASGGELSRVMLALHTMFDAAAGGRVLIFDEVDAGVGGAVADAIGSRLARLARRHQVLCLTHLAQVAAYAERHYHVHKQVSDGRTFATVVELKGASQVDELARMLGGKKVTEASKLHAAELLETAAAPRRRAATRSRT